MTGVTSVFEVAAALRGMTAAEQALARLNPARPKTARLPVVFHPRVAGGIVSHLVSAISGAAVARGTSFLKDSLGKRLFQPGIAIIDDPLRVRGRRSRVFDGEGQAVAQTRLIDDGMLTTWMMGTRSANQLGLKPTGHAGGASNLYLQAGTQTPTELMADITEGLFITELIGMGVNGLTGDYSRGASGFLITNGELAGPVAEVTIAGNLKDMFRHLTPADDLVFRHATNVPTLRIDGMTLAGA